MERVGNRRMRRNVGKVNRPATAAVAAASRASKLRSRKFTQLSASDALAKTPAKRPQTVLPKIRGNKGKSNKPREASTKKRGPYETVGGKIKNADDAEKFFSEGVTQASKLRKAHKARKVYQRMQHYIDTKGHKTIVQAYKSLDSDGKTGITLQEYKKFLDKAQLSQAFTPEEIEVSFKFADRNGNGIIDINEFVEVYSPTKSVGVRKNNDNIDKATKYERRRAHQHLDQIRDKVLQKLGQKSAASTAGGGVGKALWGAYREMDKDGNGVVDYNEFKRSMGKEKFDLKLHPNDLHSLAVACDMNGDGTISAEEFVFTIMEAGFPDLHHYFQDQRKDVILRMNTLNEQQMKKATRFGNQPRFPLRPPPPKDTNLRKDGISIKPNKASAHSRALLIILNK